MATSFVEQATLRVKDDSSKKIKKINDEIKKLMSTAKDFNRMKFQPINVRDLEKAERKLQSLVRTIRSMPRSKTISLNVKLGGTGRSELNNLVGRKPTISITPNLTGKAAFESELKKLLAPRKISVTPNPTGGGTAAGGGAVPPYRQGLPLSGGHFRGSGSMGGTIAAKALGYEFSVKSVVLHAAAFQLAASAERALINGILSGTRVSDIADTKQNLQKLTPEERTAIARSAQAQSSAMQQFSPDQIENLQAEMQSVAKGNQEVANELVRQTLEMAALDVSLGATPTEALQGAVQYSKSAEQLNRVFDQDGNFLKDSLDAYFQTLKQGMVEVGEEFGPTFIAQLTKYLKGGLKGQVSDEFLFKQILVAEELRASSASTAATSAFANLSGSRVTKKARANQIKYGIASPKEFLAGRVGDQDVIEFSINPDNAEELGRNMFQYAEDVLIPAMERAGVDPADDAARLQFIQDIASNRNAIDYIDTIVRRASDFEASWQRAQQRGDIDVQGALDQSLIAQVAAVQSQFEGLMGAVVTGLESGLNPALKFTADALNFMQGVVTGPDGQPDFLGSSTALVGTGAAVVGGGKLLGKLSPVAALNGSAANLNLAAAALKAAAASQGGVGPLGAMPSHTGKSPLVDGPSLLKMGVGGFLVYGVSQMDVEASRVNFNEKVKPLLEGAIDFIAGEGASDKLNARNEALEERAREGDVSWVTRLLRSMSDPLPAADPEAVAERQSREQRAENDRLIGEWSRIIGELQTKIESGDYSPAAVESFNSQQDRLAEQIIKRGGVPIDPEPLVDAGGDFAMALSTPLGSVLSLGATELGSAVNSSTAGLAEAIENAHGQGAATLRDAIVQALSSAVNVNVNRPVEPKLGPRLDLGSNEPR